MLAKEKYDTLHSSHHAHAEPWDLDLKNVFGVIERKVLYSFRTSDYFSRLKRACVVCWQHKISKVSEDPAMLGSKNAKSQKSSKPPSQPDKKRQVAQHEL